jgi:hypothetical protein
MTRGNPTFDVLPTMKRAPRCASTLLAAFACVLVASSVSAQVNSGDTIDKASLDRVKDLVSPGSRSS